VPIAPSNLEGELTTPTGAAIVATLAANYGPLPALRIDRIGYGAGQKDFSHPNILRVLIGAPVAPAANRSDPTSLLPLSETIVVLETNLDDCPGDVVAHAVERLWAAGALDVAVMPIQMKKSRPAVAVSVQANPLDADAFEAILFQETTTLGVRRTTTQRTVLARSAHSVETPWGPVAGKIAFLPNGTQRFTPEYEACHRLALERNLPLADVMAAAQHAFCP
jgi:hypothetical protein